MNGERSTFSTLLGFITTILGILIQVIIFIFMYKVFTKYIVFFYVFFYLMSLGLVLYLNYKDENPAYRVTWIVLLLAIPLVGVVIYLTQHATMHRNKRKGNSKKIREKASLYLDKKYDENKSSLENLKKENLVAFNQVEYIMNRGGYPTYKGTKVEYLEIGEKMHSSMLKELEKAKEFIFMEYFIVSEGKMWNEIYDVLKRKASEGVEVRVIVDYIGSLGILPENFLQTLRNDNIKVNIFNPFKKFFSTILNYRDHRKITVIDGKVAFNGGINIGDEYINAYEKHGHWKDMAVKIEGEAVFNFTILFLNTWDGMKGVEDYSKYDVKHSVSDGQGYVVGYGSSPTNDQNMGENVYLNVINCSQKYLYITTPYLILGYELVEAICRAATRGVDVRMITPFIPDKKTIQVLTRSHYDKLLSNGVKIYEYKPGFIHGKTFVCDDEISIVGTINLDYRSLYLHYECATWMYKTGVELALKEDFLKTQSVSIGIDEKKWTTRSGFKKFFESILRLFAPLT